jgi:hypothetical protein
MTYWDWLDLELGQYLDSLDRRVREAYRAAYSVLEREHRKGQEERQHDLGTATDEEDITLNREILSYEEGRWADQTEALAAMALALLASLNKSFLDEQKNRMNKMHPPAPNRRRFCPQPVYFRGGIVQATLPGEIFHLTRIFSEAIFHDHLHVLIGFQFGRD